MNRASFDFFNFNVLCYISLMIRSGEMFNMPRESFFTYENLVQFMFRYDISPFLTMQIHYF
jgi:hypothetical protein